MLTVSIQAVEKLKEVLEEQDQKDASLRVIAVPNEHGGLQYMLTVEKETQEDDTVLDIDGVRFLLDSYSAPYLDDATIDYIEEFPRAGFVIRNPKFASHGGCACGNSSCGCGHSH